jgi:RNA polymerase sigma factor (sigma-70 family)
LYGLYLHHVRRYARQLAHADSVEDLVAEAFTRTWAQLRAGAGPDRFFAAYLRAAVLHLHLRQRRRDRHLEWVPDLEADAEVTARVATYSGDALANTRMLSSQLSDALATLPHRWRQVLVMAHVENRPYTEIAALLGLSPSACRQLAHRARMGLRQALVALGDQGGLSRDRPGPSEADHLSRASHSQRSGLPPLNRLTPARTAAGPAPTQIPLETSS